MKILIADDDDLALKILRRYLTQWGHEVTSAANGEEAWAAFTTDEYPIVISDWMMPSVDGLELIRRIREKAGSSYVYTILITARAGKDDLVQGMEAGADDFVAKPFDRDELRVRLREGERIIGLEKALTEAESTREHRLRAVIAEAVDKAARDLDSARNSLSALCDGNNGLGEKIGDVLQDLAHAKAALEALRVVSRHQPAPL